MTEEEALNNINNIRAAHEDYQRRSAEFDSMLGDISASTEQSDTAQAKSLKEKNILGLKFKKKIMRYRYDSPAGIETSDDEAVMVGGPDHSVSSSRQYGNILKGPTSFTANPSQLRFATLWRMNDLLTSTVASTIMTPVPVFQLEPPFQSLARLGTIMTQLAELGA